MGRMAYWDKKSALNFLPFRDDKPDQTLLLTTSKWVLPF